MNHFIGAATNDYLNWLTCPCTKAGRNHGRHTQFGDRIQSLAYLVADIKYSDIPVIPVLQIDNQYDLVLVSGGRTDTHALDRAIRTG